MKLFDSARYVRLQQWWNTLQVKAVSGRRPRPIVVEEAESHVCKNCGTEYRGNYCPGCGQSGYTQRLSAFNAVKSVAGVVLTLDRGFLHTCIDLLLRPGHMMRDYIEGRRVQYYGPINLLFLLSMVYVVALYFLFPESSTLATPGIDPSYAADDAEMQAVRQFMSDGLSTIYGHRGLATIFVCAASAVPYWLMFRSMEPKGMRVSIWEFFYINCYMSSQRLMWYIFCLPWERLSNTPPDNTLVIPLLLTLVDMRQYFMQPWRKVVPRTVSAFFLTLVGATALILLLLLVAALVVISVLQ